MACLLCSLISKGMHIISRMVFSKSLISHQEVHHLSLINNNKRTRVLIFKMKSEILKIMQTNLTIIIRCNNHLVNSLSKSSMLMTRLFLLMVVAVVPITFLNMPMAKAIMRKKANLVSLSLGQKWLLPSHL